MNDKPLIRPPLRAVLLCIAALMFAAEPQGCYTEQRIVRDSFPDLREMADEQRQREQYRKPNFTSTGASDYAVLLTEFEGPNHQRRAEQLLQRVTAQTRVRNLWVQTLEDRQLSRLVRGRYPKPDVDAAVRELREIKALIINGATPYENARMISLSGSGLVTDDPYDLRQHAGRLSLQIGFYDPQFGETFRKAAEQAVESLRSDGEEAYFYHGPNMSVICVGIFDESDRIQRSQQSPDGRLIVAVEYSRRVKELRQKYPFNFANGSRMMQTDARGNEVAAKSFLVEVPRY